MIQLVVGECNSCIKSARILLRKCGLSAYRDYQEVNRYDVKTTKLFQERPDLYVMATAILYNRDTEQYIYLKNLQLTQEVRNEILKLADKKS